MRTVCALDAGGKFRQGISKRHPCQKALRHHLLTVSVLFGADLRPNDVAAVAVRSAAQLVNYEAHLLVFILGGLFLPPFLDPLKKFNGSGDRLAENGKFHHQIPAFDPSISAM